MAAFRRLVPPGSFLGNVAVLMSWGLLAQGLNFLLMPLLTRIYDPSQFGLFSVFTNATIFLGVVAAMRYEYAVVLPADDRESALVVWLAIETAVLFALATTAAMLVVGGRMNDWRAMAGIAPWRAWLPVALMLVAAYNAQAYWAIRHRQYARLGLSKLVITVATGATQLGAAWLLGARTGGLLAGLLTGQLTGMAYLAWGSGLSLRLAGQWREILAVAHRYSHFPRYSALGSGLDGISQLLPVAVLTATFGSAAAGHFALADRALRAPSMLLGSSLSQVFFQRLSASRANPAECRRLLWRTWKHLALFGGVPSLVAILFGPWAFALVFGARWAIAGEIARALAPGVFAYFVAFPTSNVIVVFERVGLLLIWQIAYVLLVAGCFLLGPRHGHLSTLQVVWAFSGVLVLLHGASLVLQWHVVGEGASLAGSASLVVAADTSSLSHD